MAGAVSRTKRIWERSEEAREEEGIFRRGWGGQKGLVVGGPTAIDSKPEFEVEGEGGVVGRADLEERSLGATLASSVQSVTEKASGDALLSSKGIGSQVIDVQFIEDERGREETDYTASGGGVEGDESQEGGVGEKVMVSLDPAGAQSTAEFERHRLRDQSGSEGGNAMIWSQR